MSYTEGSEQEMWLTRLVDESSEDYMERLQRAGKTFGANSAYTDLEKVTPFVTSADVRVLNKFDIFKKTLKEQMDFAEGRLIEATNQGVTDEKWKWQGYVQALRFIQSEL